MAFESEWLTMVLSAKWLLEFLYYSLAEKASSKLAKMCVKFVNPNLGNSTVRIARNRHSYSAHLIVFFHLEHNLNAVP